MIRFAGSVTTIAIVAIIAMAGGRLSTSAQTDPILSVDTSIGGNTATTVGSIETSLSTTCGATFMVDVVIQGVTNIAGFQADLLYNPAVLKVTAVDYNFLLTTTGTAVVDVGNPTPDTDGNFRLAAAMFSTVPYTGAAGDGVLARITLQTVGSGSSPLDLTSVKMSALIKKTTVPWTANAAPIPPVDINGFYAGPVNDAAIVQNPPCSIAVGGIAELPDVAGTPPELGDSSDAGGGFPAAASAAAGASALALGCALWYASKSMRRTGAHAPRKNEREP